MIEQKVSGAQCQEHILHPNQRDAVNSERGWIQIERFLLSFRFVEVDDSLRSLDVDRDRWFPSALYWTAIYVNDNVYQKVALLVEL